MTFEEMDRLVDERINGIESPVYKKAAEITKSLYAEIISLLQQIYDLKEENHRLKNLAGSLQAKIDQLTDVTKLHRVK
jgi:peptidoglycan hydrolase CwlO-like protein